MSLHESSTRNLRSSVIALALALATGGSAARAAELNAAERAARTAAARAAELAFAASVADNDPAAFCRGDR
jgi:hypothetical protein